MMKLVIATCAASLMLVGAAAAQGKMDCGKSYKDVFARLAAEGSAKMTAEQLTGYNRQALRAYDACLSGDEAFAKSIFDRLMKMGS